MSLVVKNFKIFLRHEKQQKEEQKKIKKKPYSSVHTTYVKRKRTSCQIVF